MRSERHCAPRDFRRGWERTPDPPGRHWQADPRTSSAPPAPNSLAHFLAPERFCRGPLLPAAQPDRRGRADHARALAEPDANRLAAVGLCPELRDDAIPRWGVWTTRGVAACADHTVADCGCGNRNQRQ